ncbi:MAG: VUT family protein [Gammaproteobacteria bacterium]|nr:VUT family protein [Gammaproteobacteria bacterium]
MQQRRHYKYLPYFITAFITCYLAQELLMNRLVTFGHGYITGGTFLYFMSPLILDVVAEVYGYKVARQILWCGLFSLVLFAVSIGICIHLPSPPFWVKIIDAYSTALDSIVRTSIVSIFTVFIGQSINAYLISKWRILTKGRYFWLRSLGSSVIGDSATVVLTILGTFGGRMPAGFFTANLAYELAIMVCFTAVCAVPASFLAKAVAKAEGLTNSYDIGVNFNPFKINTDKN